MRPFHSPRRPMRRDAVPLDRPTLTFPSFLVEDRRCDCLDRPTEAGLMLIIGARGCRRPVDIATGIAASTCSSMANHDKLSILELRG